MQQKRSKDHQLVNVYMLKIRLCQKNRPSAKHKSLCVYELLRFLKMILYNNFTYVFNYTRRQIYIIGHGNEYIYFDVVTSAGTYNVDTFFLNFLKRTRKCFRDFDFFSV